MDVGRNYNSFGLARPELLDGKAVAGNRMRCAVNVPKLYRSDETDIGSDGSLAT